MVRLRGHEHEQRNLLDDTQSVRAYPAAGGAESFEYIINYTLFITVKFYFEHILEGGYETVAYTYGALHTCDTTCTFSLQVHVHFHYRYMYMCDGRGQAVTNGTYMCDVTPF